MENRIIIIGLVVIGVLFIYSGLTTAFIFYELSTQLQNDPSDHSILVPVLIDASIAKDRSVNITYMAFVPNGSTGLVVIESLDIDYSVKEFPGLGVYLTRILHVTENTTFHWFIYIIDKSTEQWIRASHGLSNLHFQTGQAMLLKFESGGFV